MSAGVIERIVLAGFALAAVEVGLVVAHDRALFLSSTELWRYLALAGAVGATLAGAGFAVGRVLLEDVKRGGWGTGLALGASAGAAAWLSSEGRRLHDVPGRTPAVLLAALGVGLGAAWVARRLVRRRVRGERLGAVAAGFALAAVAALAIDAWVLRRLYPALHWSLASWSLAAACIAAWLPQPGPRRRGRATAALALWLAAVVSLPWQVRALMRAPNASFAIEEGAPLSGKLLRAARAAGPALAPAAPAAAPVRDLDWDDTGVDLRGRDVLLLSIDALRADRLGALGGSGVMPRLDALARESVVFRRAYTTTPHTSYALTGLLTGKYVAELSRLGETSLDHPTLPELLRAHGFRTAAFYPPAIFFVDEPRFAALAERRFGFEYTKRMFARAHARVEQVARYLASAPREHPLFVWVHLFEPHEPYDPPARFARGDTPLERYDAEVAAADDAAGTIVERFRAARPGATVIVLSDHGEEFGDHGGYHHGTTLYDEQVRIPLVWSSPGLAPRIVDAPVDSVDIATTLLAALGIPRDVRMRGDDLGPLLAGRGGGPAHAFASVGELRMVSDGRHKAICPRRGPCRLFDLATDPKERDDRSTRDGAVLDALRRALSAHVGSVARFEALAMRGGGAWPEALVRAHLGDETAAPELVPLLGDARPEVRAAASRAAGELGVASARIVLVRMRDEDADPKVRAEAALAAWRLGDRTRTAVLRGALASAEADEAFRRRVALALAEANDAATAPVLRALALDDGADESERIAAIRALARVGARDDVEALVALLADVRLRPEAARTLGVLGDAAAVEALLTALEGERYPEARAAEARALLALGAGARVVPVVRRLLGTPSGIPDGVELLLEAGALDERASAGGADLRSHAPARGGTWVCVPEGCEPGAGATVELPAPPGGDAAPVRIVVRFGAERPGYLEVGGERFAVDAGPGERVLAARAAGAARSLPVRTEGDVRLVAVAVVPVRPDVPPPPPRPWGPDAGTDAN